MSNFRILARNIAAECSSISDSPAMLAGLPVGNLILPIERGRTARSTSATPQAVALVFAANAQINMVALAQHNLTTAATLQSVVSNDDLSPTTLHDTTALTAWSTTGIDTDIIDHTSLDFRHRKNSVQYFDLQTLMRQLDLTITDAANPDGYVEACKVFAGKYKELTINAEAIDIQPTDSGSGSDADDGSLIVDKGYKGTLVSVNLAYIEEASDADTLLSIAEYLGRDGECWIDCYPGSATMKGIMGRGAFRLIESPTFGEACYGHQRTTLKFRAS